MEISANLNLHTIVPNKSPFVLYGIEVFTKYSKTVLIKRFNDFFQFQYILCYFAHSEYSKKKKFLDLIPKLPGHQVFVNSTSENAIKDRKLDLNYYIKSLVEIHNYFINYKPEAPWVQLIRDFLQVPDIEHKEEEAALIIQHKFKKYKNYLTYRSNIHEIYTNKGYAENVDRLPDGVFVEIFGYLSLQDLSKVARVSKRWNQISLQPIL